MKETGYRNGFAGSVIVSRKGRTIIGKFVDFVFFTSKNDITLVLLLTFYLTHSIHDEKLLEKRERNDSIVYCADHFVKNSVRG